ncbi:MAG: efflux RND transporter periplasmic adaptor subunit, partial [Rhizobium sp.]|uniref:efflux RND transporter periplasmic adaptor subunit n=1 Tax=Rhizobium sp. TaxID=391 RepID=UPI00389AAA1B
MTTDLLTLFDADEATMRKHVAQALSGADDGELFIEHAQAEALTFDNGRLKGGSFNTEQGFGLRAVAGEAVGYAHAGDLSVAALKRAADAVGAVTRGYSGSYAAAPQGTNKKFYSDENPIGQPSFEEKVKVLQDIDAYLRGKDDKVRQVTASVAASWQVVDILRADGHRVRDIRPMTRINISVMVGEGDRQESGSYGHGGRIGFGDFIAEGSWQYGADEALRQALVNLEAIDPVKADFRVPERFLPAIRVGQTIRIKVDAYPDDIFEGKVYAIDPRLDVAGRSLLVRALVPNKDQRLRPGLFARVTVLLQLKEDALSVPEQAIVPQGDAQYVFKIVNGKVTLTKVVTGTRREGRVEIVDGL